MNAWMGSCSSFSREVLLRTYDLEAKELQKTDIILMQSGANIA